MKPIVCFLAITLPFMTYSQQTSVAPEFVVPADLAAWQQQRAKVRKIYPNTGHVYTPDMWGKMLQWMEQRL